MIYFDNAATVLHRPDCVVDAVADAMRTFGASGRGVHEPALAASRAVYGCRERLARLFHCVPTRICYTMNATEALNMAIAGLFGRGDHVITTMADHNSVLRPLYLSGAEMTILGLDSKGRLNLEDLQRALRPETRGVVCTHASNVTGNVNDIAAIGKFCRENELYFVLDCAQTAGLLPIDMQALGVSVLCFTGHKSLLGPQGTGGLCVAQGIELRPILAGGSGLHSFSIEPPACLPEQFEPGLVNGHGIAGLSAGVAWIEEQGMDKLRAHVQGLARRFHDGVQDIEGVRFYGDWSTDDRVPVVSLNIGDEDAGTITYELYRQYDICTRAGVHCAPLVHEHFGTERQGMVRFSFSHGNTVEEVDEAIAAMHEMFS